VSCLFSVCFPYLSCASRYLHSFPTRRSSDLLRVLAKGAELNPTNFAYCGAIVGDAKDCREDHLLGRLNITWTEGYQKNADGTARSEEHTSELQSRENLVCRLLLEKKN